MHSKIHFLWCAVLSLDECMELCTRYGTVYITPTPPKFSRAAPSQTAPSPTLTSATTAGLGAVFSFFQSFYGLATFT